MDARMRKVGSETMTRYEDYYDPDLHGINDDSRECGGWGDECEHCKYFHDPCFPEFDDIGDDEDA